MAKKESGFPQRKVLTSSDSMTQNAKRRADDRAKELRRERKACLARADLKMAQIARELQLAQSTVQTVINLYPDKKSLRVQEYLAERLNVPYAQLWGKSPDHRHIVTNKRRAVNE